MPTISPVTSVIAAFGLFAGAFGGAVLVPEPKDPPFLIVHDLAYDAGYVTAKRTIVREGVADWRVTIASEDRGAPYCQTIPGQNRDEGWSIYKPAGTAVTTFTLDVWVGDPGCDDRLEPGPHQMFVTWTPRDKTEPVTASIDFVKG